MSDFAEELDFAVYVTYGSFGIFSDLAPRPAAHRSQGRRRRFRLRLAPTAAPDTQVKQPMNWLREPDSEPIPGYRLLEPIGTGGFGEVWRCVAPGGIHKAIK